MSGKFSEEEKKLAVELYRTGSTFEAVSQATGISVPYAKDLVRAAGVPRRPSGFQKGNPGSRGRPLSEEARERISSAHKKNRHAPSREAAQRGQPKTLAARWGSHKKNPLAKWRYIYEAGAQKRSLQFDLTENQFEALVTGDCHFCGEPPQLRKVNGSEAALNGIDRLDSSKGYSLDNCVSCCTFCNRMKMDLENGAFIDRCRRIAIRHGTPSCSD